MSESQNSPYLSIRCPNCGSPSVRYNADKQKLLCDHCGHTKDLPRDSDQIKERRLSEGFKLPDMPTGLGVETKMFHCNSCGSNRAVDLDQVRIECPFCGSENVNEEAQDTQVIQPAGLVPFSIPKSQAVEAFKGWIGKGWFRPNKLAEMAKMDVLHGVYLPFWTYDARSQSTWQADAGFYYYVTESYTDANGNAQTRQVQKTRWERASGFYETFFDDVLVVASHGLKQQDVQRVFPYDLQAITNYDSRYILGWECEVYQMDIKNGFIVAEKIMDNYIRREVIKRIPGDTHRNLRISTQKDGLTFKHILLPMWLATYIYNDKSYQFLINGQTGKVDGEKPLSWIKVTLAILAGAAAIAAIVLLMEMT